MYEAVIVDIEGTKYQFDLTGTLVPSAGNNKIDVYNQIAIRNALPSYAEKTFSQLDNDQKVLVIDKALELALNAKQAGLFDPPDFYEGVTVFDFRIKSASPGEPFEFPWKLRISWGRLIFGKLSMPCVLWGFGFRRNLLVNVKGEWRCQGQ